MSTGPGIDYGNGLTNIDHTTGIHYGVISQNEVLQAWADSSEPEYPCDGCENASIEDGCEPMGYVYEGDGYQATCGEDGDIFVIKSPYYTLCQFCSPCAPGAGYLMNYRDDGIRAYCLGHDWFEDGQAPYPVYSVQTGLVVEPTK